MTIKQHKVVVSLPIPLEPDSIYYVRNGGGFDIHVTNNSGVVVGYELNASLDKVDKEVGKSLLSNTEIVRLSLIEDEATKNRSDSENADKVHSHIIDDVVGLSTRLNGIGNLSQLPTQAKNNLVDAIIELTLSFAELIPQIDDNAGLGDTDVAWSADKSSKELAYIGSMIGDVESVLVTINGEP